MERNIWYYSLPVIPLFFCFGESGELWGVAQLMFTQFFYFPLSNHKNIDEFWDIKKDWKGIIYYIFPVIPIFMKGIKLYKNKRWENKVS